MISDEKRNAKARLFRKTTIFVIFISLILVPLTAIAQGNEKETKTESSSVPTEVVVQFRDVTVPVEVKNADKDKLTRLEQALQVAIAQQELLLEQYRLLLRQLEEQLKKFKQQLEEIQLLRQSVTVMTFRDEVAPEPSVPSEEENPPEVPESWPSPRLQFPWKFDISDQEIKLPQDTTERFPVNCDFEDELNGWATPDVWYGLDRMNSQRTCKVVYDEELESNVVEFQRTGGGADGALIGIAQDVYIDLSKYEELYLQLDVKPMFQSLTGGGWAGGGEYPVCVELAFIDQNGVPHRWQHGFYYKDVDKYPTSTKVEEGAWFTFVSPNLKEIIPLCGCKENVDDMKNWFGTDMHLYKPPVIPKVITRVLLFGGGWDYTGRADNLQFKTTLEGE
jgi:hypothetical protein